ncbi:MAG: hypothetical protein Q8P79_00515 [Nanoarchaeota archaeon]|nr:hypothetical protein [Nanoarchaeota archaeon]
MRKTLQALLAAGTIGLASLFPMKKSEAQQKTFSILRGGSPSPFNLNYNVYGENFPLEFDEMQIMGIRFGRRLYGLGDESTDWNERRINPAWEIEVYIAQGQRKESAIRMIGFSDPNNCEFGQKKIYGRKICLNPDTDNALMRIFSASFLGSLDFKLAKKGTLNDFTFYVGGGPFIRWSWLNFMNKKMQRTNYGLEFQTGVRWNFQDEYNSPQIFLEYNRDRQIPNFSGKIHELITLDGKDHENFSKIYLGLRMIFD